MLKTRIITAIVLLAILLPVLFLLPPIYFGALVALVLVLASWEWWRLIFPDHSRLAIAYAIATLLHMLIWIFVINLAWIHYLIASLAIVWLFFVPYLMSQTTRLNLATYAPWLAVFGFFLIPGLWFSVMHIRSFGLPFLLSVFLIVWGADIGAYFAGKLFGKNKLAPQLSPGKTIEGAIGGLAAVLLMAALSLIYEIPGIFLTLYELGGLLTLGSLVIALVALSIMGDLFESQLKRLAGVKDSSNLLPGHGGILDRIDALMPVLPVTAILLILLAQ